jgi:N-acetyl-anhydromuramyl-L-alanine amidase AmpD
MNPADLPIRDIKPLLPIPDVSIYLFVASVLASIVVAAALAIYGWKWWRANRRKDPRFDWLRRLERIDFSEAKRAAYTFTKYGRLLAKEKRQKEIMAQLLPRLERYKYKKEVPPLDEEMKRFMHLFIEMTRDAL